MRVPSVNPEGPGPEHGVHRTTGRQHQRRTARNRKIGAFAVAAAIAVIAVVAFATLRDPAGPTQVPAVTPSQVPTGPVTATDFIDVDTGVRTSNPAIARGSANFYPVLPTGR